MSNPCMVYNIYRNSNTSTEHWLGAAIFLFSVSLKPSVSLPLQYSSEWVNPHGDTWTPCVEASFPAQHLPDDKHLAVSGPFWLTSTSPSSTERTLITEEHHAIVLLFPSSELQIIGVFLLPCSKAVIPKSRNFLCLHHQVSLKPFSVLLCSEGFLIKKQFEYFLSEHLWKRHDFDFLLSDAEPAGSGPVLFL